MAEEWGWSKPSFIHKGQTDRYFEKRYICTIKVAGVCYNNVLLYLLSTSLLQSVSPGIVVSVLLCGKTKCLVNVLEHQFQNCLHKLKLVIEDGFLTPGGGRTEALCVARLRQKLSELNTELSDTDLLNSPNHSNTPTGVPFAMATSWTGDRTLLACWRPHVYEVCIEGLLEYIARVLINRSWSENHCGAMDEAEKLVREVEAATVQRSDEIEVLDAAKSKMAAWRRALELLQLVFLSTRVQVQRNTSNYYSYR